jgi:hypothetical protein
MVRVQLVQATCTDAAGRRGTRGRFKNRGGPCISDGTGALRVMMWWVSKTTIANGRLETQRCRLIARDPVPPWDLPSSTVTSQHVESIVYPRLFIRFFQEPKASTIFGPRIANTTRYQRSLACLGFKHITPTRRPSRSCCDCGMSI